MELLKLEFHGTFILGVTIPWNSMEFHGIWCWYQLPWNFQSSMEFHGTSLLTWKSSMEFHGTYGEFHGIPWNCEILILINFIIVEVYIIDDDFMSLYIRQSISSWNIEIFQFQSNFLVPLILVKWRYSILNGGLLYIYRRRKFRYA